MPTPPPPPPLLPLTGPSAPATPNTATTTTTPDAVPDPATTPAPHRHYQHCIHTYLLDKPLEPPVEHLVKKGGESETPCVRGDGDQR